jgi:Tol biopolymer transport system component
VNRLLVLAAALIAVPAAIGSVGNGPILSVLQSPVTGYVGLYSTRPDGAQQKRLAVNVYTAVPSPDGTTIAFTAPNGSMSHDVYVMNADGSSICKVASYPVYVGYRGAGLAWFPDSVRLVYFTPAELHLRIVDIRSGEQVPVPAYLNGQMPRAEQWSPDGTEFAYEVPSSSGSVAAIQVRSIATGAVRTVARPGTFPVWSPDGRRIAYVLAGSIYVVPREGGKRVHVGSSPPHTPVGGLYWSPDSSSLAFTKSLVPRPGTANGRITVPGVFVAQADGSGQTLVRYDATVTGWSPAGDALLVQPANPYVGLRLPPATVDFIRPDGRCLTYVMEGDPVGWLPDASPPPAFRCVDLVLHATAPALAGMHGAPITFRVTNAGTDIAHDVEVREEFSSTGLFVSLPRACELQETYIVICRVPTLKPGRSVTFSLLVRRTMGAGGNVIVRSADRDSDPFTNYAETHTSIFRFCWIAGTNGSETLIGTSKGEMICALDGSDKIYGLGGNDKIDPGAGNDVVYPGPGRDRVIASDGNDTVYSRDGTRDVIACGDGVDRVFADRLDVVGRDCEVVVRR